MKESFDQAYEKLTDVISQLEDDDIQLDSLAEKVRVAKELIEYCEMRLRVIRDEVGESAKKTGL